MDRDSRCGHSFTLSQLYVCTRTHTHRHSIAYTHTQTDTIVHISNGLGLEELCVSSRSITHYRIQKSNEDEEGEEKQINKNSKNKPKGIKSIEKRRNSAHIK